jgi:hypothetical protein
MDTLTLVLDGISVLDAQRTPALVPFTQMKKEKSFTIHSDMILSLVSQVLRLLKKISFRRVLTVGVKDHQDRSIFRGGSSAEKRPYLNLIWVVELTK